ncbi:hypothetical protein [Actinokineospora terrae]|uniref:hypothetical protein n=1 Tax=Actinokineospora terrae TaxID=155974 RepID=UPI0011602757|nr:hypothetical protein [Actinokineospora terrae]
MSTSSTFLDCHDPQSAVRSLSTAFRVEDHELLLAIKSCRVRDYDAPYLEERILAKILKDLGVRGTPQFAGTYFFHGTRTFDSGGFSVRGVLPLTDVLDELWTSLHSLIGHIVTRSEWEAHRRAIETTTAGGHGGWQYRLKTRDPGIHAGPYAHLIRELHLTPSPERHDYLAVPEIVQDIARTCDFNLIERYTEATTPCVVKFRTSANEEHAYQAAFWYVYAHIHGDAPPQSILYAYSGQNKPVQPHDVLSVELIANADTPGGPPLTRTASNEGEASP